MQDTCDLSLDQLETNHKYYMNCYKYSHINLDSLAHTSSESTPSAQPRTSTDDDMIIFKPDCISCKSESRKSVKVKVTWTTQGMSMFECDGWITILEMPEMKQAETLLTRIRGQDLVACEAKHNWKYLTDYLQKPDKWQSDSTEVCKEQASLTTAQQPFGLCIT